MKCKVFWKTSHAMPGWYLQSSCSLTGIVHLDLLHCGEAVDRLKDCLLPLPFLTSVLIDIGSQLSLDAPFLGCIQGRYVLTLMTPCQHLSCFSTIKWSKHWVLTVSTHKGLMFRIVFSNNKKKNFHSYERGKKLIGSEYGILACSVHPKIQDLKILN